MDGFLTSAHPPASLSSLGALPGTSHVRLSPDELARLDTSVTNFLNNYTVPSIRFDSNINTRNNPNTSHNQNTGLSGLEEIGGGLTAGRLMASSGSRIQPAQTPATPYNAGQAPSVIAASTRAMPPTPPMTSPMMEKPMFYNNPPITAYNPVNATTASNSRDELRRLYEERIAAMRRNEEERIRLLEEEHRNAMFRLQSAKEDAAREMENIRVQRSESERSLKEEVDRLRSEIARLSTHQPRLYQSESAMISRLKEEMKKERAEYERRISDLIDQFDREKRAASRILQSKLRSHLALLLPKLRDRAKSAMLLEQEERMDRLRRDFEERLERMRMEMVQERRVAVRQAREEAEAEYRQWQMRAKERMRLKLLQVRNEAERAVLERIKGK